MGYPTPAAVRQPSEQLTLESRTIYRWRADEMKLDPMTGQTPVFTRASTAAGVDVNGDAITYGQNDPCWNWKNARPELLLGAGVSADVLYYAHERIITEFSFLLRCRQEGAMAAAGDGFFYVGAASEIGNRIWVESNGTNYSLRLHGGAEVGSTMSSAPSDDDEFELRGEVYLSGANYIVRLSQSINAGAEVTASASSAQAVASFPANTRVYLGSLGGQNPADVGLREVIVARGTQLTLAQLNDEW